MPPGLTQQQQVLWLQQQQGKRQVVVRAGTPGLSPIQQQPGVGAPQQQQSPQQQAFNPNDPNQQMLMQRQQLRVQQIPIQQQGPQQLGKQTVQLMTAPNGQLIEQQTIVQQPQQQSTPGTPTTPGAGGVLSGNPNIMTQTLVMTSTSEFNY